MYYGYHSYIGYLKEKNQQTAIIWLLELLGMPDLHLQGYDGYSGYHGYGAKNSKSCVSDP